MQKQTAINLVANNISSVFTKEDVINLLKGIDADPKLASKDEDETDEVNEVTFTDETVKELIEHVAHTIGGLFADDIIDKDSAQFGIDGRDTIVLEDVDLDGRLEDIVADSIAEFFEDLKNNN
jgi:hypothetical protein